jgi:hypothetical protein
MKTDGKRPVGLQSARQKRAVAQKQWRKLCQFRENYYFCAPIIIKKGPEW